MRFVACIAAAFVFAASPAFADDVTDAIAEGLAAYEDGDFAYAKESLDFASQLIAQKKAEGLVDFLPDAMDGWTLQEGESNTMAAGMFGGGAQASRSYINGDGKEVNINLIADSPMVAQMAMMFSNPAMMGASGKMMRIGREKGVLTQDGEIQMMIGGTVLATVSGSASEDDKVAYAKGIDARGLKAR